MLIFLFHFHYFFFISIINNWNGNWNNANMCALDIIVEFLFLKRELCETCPFWVVQFIRIWSRTQFRLESKVVCPEIDKYSFDRFHVKSSNN